MDNREKSTNSDPIIRFAFWVTIILIIIILILFNFFVGPDTSTPADDITSTQDILSTNTTISSTGTGYETPTIETATPIEGIPINEKITPTPFPSPIRGIIGTNLPNDFQVGPWRDNYVGCENKAEVEIQGVKIINGVSPYQFVFWQDSKKWEPIVNLSTSSETYIEFKQAIIVSKGEYIHVEITFISASSQQAIWIDDLYYPFPEFFSDC